MEKRIPNKIRDNLGRFVRRSGIIHGLWGTQEYWIWHSMKYRCQNPNHKNYKDYGGRGIRVCDAWQDFSNFYADMGNRPEGLTLDRINNDGNYEPENCKWSTQREQSMNTRFNSGRYIQHWFFAYNENTGEWDEDDSQREFARRHGLKSQGNISSCLCGKRKQYRGWTFIGE